MTKHTKLLKQIIAEDGPIRILIYRSVAQGLYDPCDRYIAQSIWYGQTASGESKDVALRRVLVQIVAFLSGCYEDCKREGITFNRAMRFNWADEVVLKAFAVAPEYTINLATFFATEFQDINLALRVHEAVSFQDTGKNLEEAVEKYINETVLV